MADETYDFDASITVMADGKTKQEAANLLLERFFEMDIAVSLSEPKDAD